MVIVRRSAGPRGAVVEMAAERGAKAVLMFGERADGGVERGTVVLGGPGDPLTPGWAAVDGGERLRVEDEEVRRRFPRIPSTPVSLSTAREVLRRLGGPRLPTEWRGEVVGEWSGVGGGDMLVNFTYQVKFHPPLAVYLDCWVPPIWQSHVEFPRFDSFSLLCIRVMDAMAHELYVSVLCLGYVYLSAVSGQ